MENYTNKITEHSRYYFTVPEFCDKHVIGRSTFYQEVGAGRLRVIKRGRRTLVPREEAQAWRQRLMADQADNRKPRKASHD